MSMSSCTLNASTNAVAGRWPRSVSTMHARAAVVGGSGFTGLVLAELLLHHPSLHLIAMTSERLAGRPVELQAPRLHTDLCFGCIDELPEVEAAFVCLPHGEAAPAVKQLLDAGVRVVDLSADFRLDAAGYAAWYGAHPFPELLPAVYGLTELHRDQLPGAQLVANPGCYPTAALLALTPLLGFGLYDVVIDAKSGVSGAGKSASERTHFCSVDSDLAAYAIGGHRHYPEVVAGLSSSGAAPSLTFVPHLVPLQRGIQETIYARAAQLPAAADLRALYRQVYASERFVHVVDEPPQLKDVTHTNDCRIYVTVDELSGRIVIVSVIDNLMKGAAGQAVQNMNVMLGLPEHEGLL
jgi:N-acetyl-gamma-glutamyl-phosphate reductase